MLLHSHHPPSGQDSSVDALLLQLVRRQLLSSGLPSQQWPEREHTLLQFAKQLLGSAMKPTLLSGEQIEERLKKRALRHSDLATAARVADKLALIQLGNKAAVLYFLLRLSERESLSPHPTNFTPLPKMTSAMNNTANAGLNSMANAGMNHGGMTLSSEMNNGGMETVVAVQSVDVQPLLRELLFVLRGMETPSFRLLNGRFVLLPQVAVGSRPQRQLLEVMAQMGVDYRLLELFSQQQRVTGGVVAVGLRATVQNELQQLVHPPLLAFEANQLATATLLGAAAFFRPLGRQLQTLRSVVEAVANLRPEGCLDQLARWRGHGDPQVAALATRMTQSLATPYFERLTAWLEAGELVDPHQELFIASEGEGFKLLPERVPTVLIAPSVAERIYRCGKMVHFLRSCRVSRLPAKTGPLLCETSLAQLVEERYAELAQAIKNLFLQVHGLPDYLGMIRDCMLLGRSDFCHALIEGLGEALTRPAASILRHNVLGVLEGCLRETRLGHGKQALDAVDVRLSEAKANQVGWDIFGLDCRIPAPLDTLLTAEVMREFQRLGQFLWHLKRVEYAAVLARRRLVQARRLDAGELRIDFRRHAFLQHEALCVAGKLVAWAFQQVQEGWQRLWVDLHAAGDLEAMSAALWAFLGHTRANLVLWSNQALKGRLANLLSCILRCERATNQLIAMASTGLGNLKLLTEQRGQLQTLARQFQADLDELLLQLRKESACLPGDGGEGEEMVRASFRSLQLELDYANYHGRRSSGFDQAKYAAAIKTA